ncbi:MAG: hypothetical protein GX591_10245 [Planctomycetes bacterium]|nr:hypothetical protein [Planctomycetota bacterium]
MTTKPSALLTLDGQHWLLDGRPFDLWGIRTASGTMNDAQCRHLIDQFDDYLAHGVNAVTVFYQGCRGGNYDPFTPDGTAVDAGHQARMERILQAAAGRGMVVIVGLFYQAAPITLADAAAVRNAVRTVTEALRPYRNVILNVCNEPNSGEWKKFKAFDFNDPRRVIDLCRLVHDIDGDRIVGGGGYDHAFNPVVGRSDDVDVLLFDTAGIEHTSGALFDRFRAEGVDGKPMVNVETFGGWTKQFPRGVFDEDVRAAYFREIDDALARPGLSVFFHNNPWCQSTTEPLRYDLGGYGTAGDPGIRWYFERVRERRRTAGCRL